ncbi:HD domain-containing protein [Foetidibacter luteolus]|uniref:HD domain-containing protein n=1 Tax=Foetidibacter luteolus TaxID=2608880 RepID=UPI00129C01C4|nr:HDIG domain-containing metalloprotein [Foetidibacter luteolus]
MTKETPVTVQQKVEELFRLYEQHGNEEYGEGVTQLMHMVQCALLARQEGYDDEMVLAAFFHDIGHLLEHSEEMGLFGKKDHDKLGHDLLLQYGFSERVAKLVYSHVATKRYLTYAEPGYYEKLSGASKATLAYQGGPMSITEAAAYEKDPLLQDYIKIRYWDDLGKEEDQPVNPQDIAMIKQLTLQYLLARQQ